MILVFDIGNSRIKWGFWQAGEMLESGVISCSKSALQVLMKTLLVSHEPPAKVQAVCVANREIELTLQHSVQQCWMLDVEFLRTQRTFVGRNITLLNAYTDVSRHGADRWAALIAASDEFLPPLCVISAGTAITLDLVNADGQHLGGRILPGFRAMQAAVLQNASAIRATPTLVEAETAINSNGAPPELFAKDTDGAVISGIYYLLEAGLREACNQVAGVPGVPSKIIITGGSAETVLGFSGLPELIHRPTLVMQGVYTAFNKA